jgi:hypothetical protein
MHIFPFFQKKVELIIIHIYIMFFFVQYASKFDFEKNLVWSVGCIFYELVHRKPLFPGDENVYMCMECSNTFQTHIYIYISMFICKVGGWGEGDDVVLLFWKCSNV